ncbi:MAG: hypothetical protein BKP49_06995 [Treponema sp. CETP13]|nr:MAG: hypothetical protein BKP49_06995 [Treponema sp. CETP13]
MKGKIIGIVVILLIVVGAVVVAPKIVDKYIAQYGEDISSLKEETYPLHFVITKRDGTSVSGKYIFYNDNNEVIGEPHTFNMPGNEVFFDFIIADLDNAKVVFPYLIFTDQIAPDDGIYIAKQYERNGFPAIFSQTSSTKYNKKLLLVYTDILNRNNLKNTYGNAVHDTSELGEFILGQEYRILVHSKGGIEIVPNDR